MRRKLLSSALLAAAAITLGPAAVVTTTTPAAAQASFSVSFGYFHDELAPYGQWYRHPRWGDVWHPASVERDFRPYYRGHWEPTREYGWVWESDYPFGDITFHYGRWVYDRYDGWLWVPGYVWAPAWVIWRGSNDYVGWFPMPPDDRFLAGDEVYRTDWNNWNTGFGYADWYGPQFGLSISLGFWNFVDMRHFAERDYYRYAPPRNEYTRIINNTTNITNYTTVNNVVVNRSVDINRVEQASGRRFQPLPAQQVVKTPITPVNVGTQVQTREVRVHGGDPKASPQARVAVLPPNAARATEPPPEGRGGAFNRQNPQQQQREAQPNQAPQNQAAPPPQPNEPRRGGPFGQQRPEPQPPQGAPNRPEQGLAPNEQVRRGGPNQERAAPQGAPNRPEQGPQNEQVRRGGPNQEQAAPQGAPNRPDQGPQNEQARRNPFQGTPPNEQAQRGGPPNREQGPPQAAPNRPEQNAPPAEQARRGNPPEQQPNDENARGRGNNRRGAENAPAPNAPPPPQVTQREQRPEPQQGPPQRQVQPPPTPQAAPQPPPPREQANNRGQGKDNSKDDEEKNRRGRP